MTAQCAAEGASMKKLNVANDQIDRLVDDLFAAFRYGENRQNPVTGAGYVHGVDPIGPQKKAARRVLRVREWFAIDGPADAPPFPVSYDQREALKGRGLLPHIVAWYARSLECREYDVREHPSFADYASGVLWELELPVGGFGDLPNYPPDELRELKKRFPPRMLKGMGPGLHWLPPKLHREIMASVRRSSRNAEVYFNRE